MYILTCICCIFVQLVFDKSYNYGYGYTVNVVLCKLTKKGPMTEECENPLLKDYFGDYAIIYCEDNLSGT